MKISKNSTLFQMAYFFEEKKDHPTTVNICSFFWRVVFMVPLAVVVSIVIIFIVCLMTIPAIIVGPFFGRKMNPEFLKFLKGLLPFVDMPKLEYDKDKNPYTQLTVSGNMIHIKGRSYPLIVFIVLGALPYLLAGSELVDLPYTVGEAYGIFAITFLLMVSIPVLIKKLHISQLSRKIATSDFVKLTKVYLKARKDNVCPLIEVVD